MDQKEYALNFANTVLKPVIDSIHVRKMKSPEETIDKHDQILLKWYRDYLHRIQKHDKKITKIIDEIDNINAPKI